MAGKAQFFLARSSSLWDDRGMHFWQEIPLESWNLIVRLLQRRALDRNAEMPIMQKPCFIRRGTREIESSNTSVPCRAGSVGFESVPCRRHFRGWRHRRPFRSIKVARYGSERRTSKFVL